MLRCFGTIAQMPQQPARVELVFGKRIPHRIYRAFFSAMTADRSSLFGSIQNSGGGLVAGEEGGAIEKMSASSEKSIHEGLSRRNGIAGITGAACFP